MLQPLQLLGESLVHYLLPHVCACCGSDLPMHNRPICLQCSLELPCTQFENLPDNPVEKIFWGRLPLQNGCSHFYFSKDSALQSLLHQLKYKGREDIGRYLGREMGQALFISPRFSGIDALLPLPLHPSRERKRGYNQALLLSEGISEQTGWPILKNSLHRKEATRTQTQMNRLERWENMEGMFEINNPESIQNLHLLLIDDVITTGATLEAAGTALLKVAGCQLSLASLAYALR